jgi:hypothetical protein
MPLVVDLGEVAAHIAGTDELSEFVQALAQIAGQFAVGHHVESEALRRFLADAR